MLGRKDYTQEELAAYRELVKALDGSHDDPRVQSAQFERLAKAFLGEIEMKFVQ
jgi:hypothetical protein